MGGSRSLDTMNLLKFVVLFQYVPRVVRVHPLYKEATITSGIFTKTAWSEAALNLFLYMLAGHVLGAFWYLFSIERETTCWKKAYGNRTECVNYSVYCDHSTGFKVFLNESCSIETPNAALFDFGIFLDALQSGVVGSTNYPEKFFYCFWWGLQNLRQFSWSKPQDKYLCLGNLLFCVRLHIWLGIIFPSHRKYAVLSGDGKIGGSLFPSVINIGNAAPFLILVRKLQSCATVYDGIDIHYCHYLFK
ncbi:hypothetical protein Vadar_021545 [Vaccinium darrowii]|uniref:Uncharacterized protein n=1 Tax=Vaccinium darrowii TaxID=229202 RepID=A0ACB7Y8G3_9ERIC|nr:hypothetical protein Vadar_021545 [Vaccinium darrowii]